MNGWGLEEVLGRFREGNGWLCSDKGSLMRGGVYGVWLVDDRGRRREKICGVEDGGRGYERGVLVGLRGGRVGVIGFLGLGGGWREEGGSGDEGLEVEEW